MKKEIIALWEKEEYEYPLSGDFIPNMAIYLHEDKVIRPAMLVVPGGSYMAVAPTESEIVAMKFYEKGYQVFVVTYTVNLTMQYPLFMQPLKDLTKAILTVRQNAELYQVNPHQVAVCGFSAGGHLAGSLAVHYDDECMSELVAEAGVSNRPDAVILSYPVISSGEYAHRESFLALLGENATEEQLCKMSLEKQVKSNTPPTFIWQTATDEQVPVENSYLYALACKKQGVMFEHHVFPKGLHGMSVADSDWAAGRCGGTYTLKQFYEVLCYLQQNDKTQIPEQFREVPEIHSFEEFEQFYQIAQSMSDENRVADETVAKWPDLAEAFLDRVFKEEKNR